MRGNETLLSVPGGDLWILIILYWLICDGSWKCTWNAWKNGPLFLECMECLQEIWQEQRKAHGIRFHRFGRRHDFRGALRFSLPSSKPDSVLSSRAYKDLLWSGHCLLSSLIFFVPHPMCAVLEITSLARCPYTCPPDFAYASVSITQALALCTVHVVVMVLEILTDLFPFLPVFAKASSCQVSVC